MRDLPPGGYRQGPWPKTAKSQGGFVGVTEQRMRGLAPVATWHGVTWISCSIDQVPLSSYLENGVAMAGCGCCLGPWWGCLWFDPSLTILKKNRFDR